MLKHIILFIAFSVVAMLLQPQLQHVLYFLLYIHDKIADALASIFSSAPSGRMIQETIALLVIPVIAGVAAGVMFWLVKRHEMPHIIAAVWFVWTVLLVTILAQPVSHAVTKTAYQSTAYIR